MPFAGVQKKRALQMWPLCVCLLHQEARRKCPCKITDSKPTEANGRTPAPVNRLGSGPRHVCVKSLGTLHSLFRHNCYHKDTEKLKEGQKTLLPQAQELERLNSGWIDLNQHTGSLDLYN